MGALGTWDLADELQTRPDSRRTTTIATVSRVDDDGSVWVRLPGADTDTPVNGQTYVDVSPGQTVQATIEGGRCSITGNSSSPAVGGGYVRQVVAPVEQKADAATDDAKRAKEAADAAELDAGRANAAANAAQEDANTANRSARQALLGLSTVEDVVNVLEWLAAHSKATTDTTVVAGKAYYQRDATTGTMTRYEVPAGGNPASLGLYELDDAVADYIAAHLALTNHGLNIMLDSSSGYIHLGTVDGTYAKGMYFIDGGDIVALFGAIGARIGKSDGNHVTIDDDSIDMSHGGLKMAHFGYGDGNASSGTGTAPYYTLGVRRSTTAAYDPSSTYAVGDHVVRNGTEYVCTVAIPTAEPWNAGHWTSAIGNYSAVDGFNATAGGYCSHAEGYETTAGGSYSHAEGRNTAATGSNASHAEGRETMASGTTSHAEGYNVTASGIYSHAEGASTTASNYATHAEGGLCEASGWASHAEGYDTTASGNYSHAQNYGTVAAYNNQTAIGKYNDNQSTNAFEIGNGTDTNNRSNAFAVDWNGNIEIAGTVKGGLGEMLPSKRNNADSATNLYQYAQIGGNSSQTFDMTSNMLTIFARRGTVWGIWIVTVWDSPLLAAGNGTNITVTFNLTTKVATVSNGNSGSIVVTAFS